MGNQIFFYANGRCEQVKFIKIHGKLYMNEGVRCCLVWINWGCAASLFFRITVLS